MTTDSAALEGDVIDFPRELDIVVDGLKAARQDWRKTHARHAEHGVHFPSRASLERIMRELGVALFPLRLGPPELNAGNENAYVAATLESVLSQLEAQIRVELRLVQPGSLDTGEGPAGKRIIDAFAASLPGIRRLLDEDVEAGYASDPAARSVDEILLSYPAISAVIHYRVASRLYQLGAPVVARIITEIAHSHTGIDIHPGARIGRSFFIDHGTGVVIGETTVIGDRVRLFQGVTLGGDPAGTGADRETAPGQPRHPQPRHPELGDDVVVHAGAVILGHVRIGARSIVGGNLWLRGDVPPDSIVEAPAPTIRARGAD